MKCLHSGYLIIVLLCLLVFSFKTQAQPVTGKLYIIGTAVASGWTNPMTSTDSIIQQFTKISATEYRITVSLIGGGEYKFIDSNGYWGDNWGIAVQDNSAEIYGGALIYGVSVAQNILAPTLSGTYTIDVNFSTNIFTIINANPGHWVNIDTADYSTRQLGSPWVVAFNNGIPYIAYSDYVGNGGKVKVMKYNGNSWGTVGNAGFSAGLVQNISLGFNGNTPYVAYQDKSNGNKATVMMYNGSSWVTVGNAGFSAGQANGIVLAFNGNTPYVVFGNLNDKTTVMMYNGSNWITEGNDGFSVSNAGYFSLAFNGSIPYVAYQDATSNSYKVTVMMYNGSSWVNVGSPSFSAGQANYISLAFNGSTPYVAYQDGGNKGTVMMYNGNSWVNVGIPGFSLGAYNISLSINGSIPYVAYQDGSSNLNQATVMMYTNGGWVTVGSADFSVGAAVAINLAFNGSTPYVAYVDGSSGEVTVMAYLPTTITSFTPSSGSYGNAITIKGAGFTGATAVSFGDSAANSFNVLNDSTIIAYIGNGASGKVAVTTEGFIITIPGFIYVPPPLPTTGKLFIVGTAVAGGWANPIPVMDSAAQQFTKISATEYKITLPLMGGGEYKFIDSNGYWGDNWGITIKDNPADTMWGSFVYGVHIAQNILAPALNGTYTIDVNFKTGIFTVKLVNASPTIINSFTPSNGCPGTTITISGQNFTGATAVNIGGVPVDSYNVVNDNIIEAIVANENTKGVITVFSPLGVGTSRATYMVGGNVYVLAYITNSRSNTVSVINTTTKTIIGTFPVGKQPYGLYVSPDGSKAYVTNAGSNSISVINTFTNSVIATIPVGSFPNGVCVSPDGSKVYVTNVDSNSISVINTSTNSVLATIPVGSSPYGVNVNPDGSKVYVTNSGSNSISVINTFTNSVIATIPVGGSSPYGVIVSPDGSKVYVTNSLSNSISVINTSTNYILATIPVGSIPYGVSVTPDGSKVYVTNYNSSSVSIINTISNTVIATILVGNYPIDVSVSPDGSKAYIIGGSPVIVISTATNTIIDTIKAVIGDNNIGNFISNVVLPCPPVINSISKDSACLNEVITLTGYFYGIDSVKFNGKSVPFTINSNTSLSVTLNKVGKGYLTVMDLGGIAISEKPLNVDSVPNFQVVPTNFQLCGGNARQINTTLKSPLGYEYICSNGQTGDSITVNATGTYTLNVKDTFGCKNSTGFNVTNYTPCGGYLEIHSDTVANYFGDTIHVKVTLKGGGDIFSCYGYLQFDTAHLTLLDSKSGSYLGVKIINRPPVITGNQINFGVTKMSGQAGSNGDGEIYEFRFLLNTLPNSIAFDSLLSNYLKVPFTLSGLTVYNTSGVQPPSFNAISLLSDTTLCRYYVPVWPGDLNNDKVVNVADLLPIGYFYGQTGSLRPNATLGWYAQPGILWGFDKTNTNSNAYEVFADGNGDGKIDLADYATIGFNLSKLHARKLNKNISNQNKTKNHTPEINSFVNVLPNTPQVILGMPDTLIKVTQLPYSEVVSINIGSSVLPLNNLYGIAFDITFDPSFVDVNNISTDYSNSIFGNLGADYSNLEDFSDIANGRLSIAMTRYSTSTINATGGLALNITLPFINGGPNGRFRISINPIGCNDKNGNKLNVTGSNDSLIVGSLINNYNIAGNLITPSYKMISGATVLLNGIGNSFSNNYSYNITGNSNEILKAFKNNDINKTNGVTALDIALVQAHILQKNLLKSPFKIIAADVNGDGKVTALDIVYTKRLILGIDTTFTNTVTSQKRLWAFVDSTYKFPDTTNPFPIKDSISYTGLNASQINQTFIGCKLGDVNWDWNPAVARPILNNLNAIELSYPSVRPGRASDGYIRIPVKVKNFKDMLGIQFTISFNSNILQWQGMGNNPLGIETGTNHAADGSVSFLWVDPKNEIKTLEDGSVLMELVFVPNYQLSTINYQLSLDGSITEIAAYDKDYNLHDIIMNPSLINTSDIVKETFTVAPNPTTEGVIHVQMNLKNNKTIVFRLIDNSGRLLLTQQIEGIKGNNNIILKEQSQIPAGTYFLQTIGMEGEVVKKIIIK